MKSTVLYPSLANEMADAARETARRNPAPCEISGAPDDGLASRQPPRVGTDRLPADSTASLETGDRRHIAARGDPAEPTRKRPLLYSPVDLGDMYENLATVAGGNVSTLCPSHTEPLTAGLYCKNYRARFFKPVPEALLKTSPVPVELRAPEFMSAHEQDSPPSSPTEEPHLLECFEELDESTITCAHLMKLQKAMIDHDQNLSFPFALLVEKCSETVLNAFVRQCEPVLLGYKISLTEILVRVSGSCRLQEDARFMECLLSKSGPVLSAHCMARAMVSICSRDISLSGMPNRNPRLPLFTACRFLLDAGATIDRTVFEAALGSDNEELMSLTLDKAFSNPADFGDFDVLVGAFKTCYFLGESGKAKYLIELLADMARKNPTMAAALKSLAGRSIFFTPTVSRRFADPMNKELFREFDMTFGEIDCFYLLDRPKQKQPWKFWK